MADLGRSVAPSDNVAGPRDPAKPWTDYLIGRRLGPGQVYSVASLIGEGGMGAVFDAYHETLGRRVALKVLNARLTEDPSFIARFRREAQLVARLEHNNIIPVYDYGEEDGLFYVVMRQVTGGSVRDRFIHNGNRPWTLDEVTALARQILPGLQYAHGRGVVHRDIKPGNILLDNNWPERGNAYLADFGLAKLVQDSSLGDATVTTMQGHYVGTPEYSSPEQVQGLPLDSRSDIYSFGVVLYQLMTGSVPYPKTIHDTPQSAALKHLHAPLPSPINLNPSISSGVSTILEQALARDPDDRFASADQMLKALEWQAQTPALPVTPPQTTLAAQSPTVAARLPTTSSMRPSARGAGFLAVSAVAFLGVAWLVMGALTSPTSTNDPRVGSLENKPVATVAGAPTSVGVVVSIPTPTFTASSANTPVAVAPSATVAVNSEQTRPGPIATSPAQGYVAPEPTPRSAPPIPFGAITAGTWRFEVEVTQVDCDLPAPDVSTESVDVTFSSVESGREVLSDRETVIVSVDGSELGRARLEWPQLVLAESNLSADAEPWLEVLDVTFASWQSATIHYDVRVDQLLGETARNCFYHYNGDGMAIDR